MVQFLNIAAVKLNQKVQLKNYIKRDRVSLVGLLRQYVNMVQHYL